MPNINISIDTSDLRKADVWLATMSGQMPFVASRAISATAKSIHTNLKARLPSAVNKPTNWTTRGLMVRYGTRANPTAVVGFNYGDGSFSPTGARDSSMGVPSGRYMDVLARGGTRSAKASELAIRRQLPAPPVTVGGQQGSRGHIQRTQRRWITRTHGSEAT